MSKSSSLLPFSQQIMSQTTRYFCLLKCSPCQIRRLKNHKFLPCRAWETWQTAHCSPINHRLQFTMGVMSPARKRSPLTTTDKATWEVNKKSNMQVFLSWGRKVFQMWHQLSFILTHYTRWNDQLWHPMLINCFQAYLKPYVFLVRLLSGWYHVVWTWY